MFRLVRQLFLTCSAEPCKIKAAEFTASIAVRFHKRDETLTVLKMARNVDPLL
jgi:hypothetical protein